MHFLSVSRIPLRVLFGFNSCHPCSAVTSGAWSYYLSQQVTSSLLLLRDPAPRRKGTPSSDHICFALPFRRTAGLCLNPSADGKCCQWFSAKTEGKPQTEGNGGHRQRVNIEEKKRSPALFLKALVHRRTLV